MRRALIILLFLSIIIPPIKAGEYGEESDALGQFVDDFENLNNISVAVNVLRNSTYNAMELNDVGLSSKVLGDPYLREHDYYIGLTPSITWAIGGNDYVDVSSTVGGLGHGYVYLHIDREWMDGKYLRWRWDGYYSGGSNKQVLIMYGIDEQWDRTDNNHFPEVSRYGQQLEIFKIPAFKGWSGWRTEDYQYNNVSGGSNPIMTVAFTVNDAWSANSLKMLLDFIEINTGAGGVGNILTINFNNSTPVWIEQAGTQDDYGMVNDTVLPYQLGGYDTEGYFTSTDYLSDPNANGSVLVQMVNTSIPANTVITIEFSNDNSTWVLNDWEPLFGGFESIDLRLLNYSTNHFTRFNLSTTDSTVTPRVYQSRLITTIGNSTGGGGVPTVGGGLNSSTILMLILLFALAILVYWGIKRK